MAFNLKKVLRALLLSSNQPLSIKDLQAAFTRFHEQASSSAAAAAAAGKGPSGAGSAAAAGAGPAPGSEAGAGPAADGADGAGPGPGVADGGAPAPDGAASAAVVPEAAEAPAVPENQDPELYQDVPSLITGTQIRETMAEIAAEFTASGSDWVLVEGASGFRVALQPRFARWIRILREEPPPVRLSQSSIETLAVIAYRQPVTRAEIESIRGVSAEAGLARLQERDLIQVTGRADLPGRPIQFGTTDHFLEFTGLKSLDELPASDVLSSRQIDAWLTNAQSGPAPGDAEMGLGTDPLPMAGADAAETGRQADGAGAGAESPADPARSAPAAP